MQLETGRGGVTLIIDESRRNPAIVQPTPEAIEAQLRSLDLRTKPWAMLKADPGGRGYIKAAFGQTDFYVEVRDARTGRTYAAARDLPIDRVVELFLSFARGDGLWTSAVPWRDLTWALRSQRWGHAALTIILVAVILLVLLVEVLPHLRRFLANLHEMLGP